MKMTPEELREKLAKELFDDEFGGQSYPPEAVGSWEQSHPRRKEIFLKRADKAIQTFLQFCKENDAKVVVNEENIYESQVSGDQQVFFEQYLKPLSSLFKEGK